MQRAKKRKSYEGIYMTYINTITETENGKRKMAEIIEWNIRVDQQYWHMAQKWLDDHKYKYFCALEKATNWHYQGVLYATRTAKDDLSKKIKTPGHKNGKGFPQFGNKYDNALQYCCKGLGKHGTMGTPPTAYSTNMPGMTPQQIEIYHKQWFKNNPPKASDHIEGPYVGKRKRETVFKTLVDQCEAEGYHYYDSILEKGEIRKSLTPYTAVKKMRKVYRDDSRLAGTGIMKRTVEGLMAKFCSPHDSYRFDLKLEQSIMDQYM
jgi:hypothetical protein